MRRLCKEAKASGFKHMKIKVGSDLNDDMRRAAIIREEIGTDLKLMMDANQKWDVDEAIANMAELKSLIHGGSRNQPVLTIFWAMLK